MKKTLLVIFILLLNSCGFTPIYSTKDSNFKVDSLKSNVSNNLTNYIQNSITVFSNEDSKKNFNIIINFSEDITVILKDSKGDPSKNRLTITVDLSVLDASQNLIASNKFIEGFQYNIDDNKFNLKQYEKNIKFSLVEQITQQMLNFLANLK
tara:strand:- start:1434 stop:1889 length:456 start_codon:yes stop_codon:yes gene_type:complete